MGWSHPAPALIQTASCFQSILFLAMKVFFQDVLRQKEIWEKAAPPMYPPACNPRTVLLSPSPNPPHLTSVQSQEED